MIFRWLKSGTKGTVLLYALLIAVHAFFALPVYANTVWNPVVNGIVPPDVGNWGDPNNWTNGLPVLVGDSSSYGTHTKAAFNVANAAECQVTDVKGCVNVVVGDGGQGDDVLRIMNGGDLTSTSWLAVGYSRNCQMIVETGGVANIGGHLWMAATSVLATNCVLDINGGTVNIGGNIGLGTVDAVNPSGGVAYINVNDGVLNLDHWNAAQSIQDGSVLDIELGYVTIGGDQTEAVSGYVAAGRITAYGGSGRVLYDYNITNPGKTTIRGIYIIENPSFELYDPNGGPDFDVATGWFRENYAVDANCLLPTIEPQDVGYGSADNWLNNLNTIGLHPKDGNRLLMLSTGNISSRDPIYHSKAWQTINVQEGDRISGYYFFGTCDYLDSVEYDDYATISLTNNVDPNSHILLVNKSVEEVGDHSSTAGWERFEHRFTSDEAGLYDLTFFVTDVVDSKVNSYLGVDDLQLCAAPAYGDINYDCQANNLDFAVISSNWLIDCEGPDMSDPNYCSTWTDELGSPGDLDGDNKVDIEDIKLMSIGWLGGE
ncbi:MAG: hypothetical protein KAJ07_03855 [Planctomycetes bacterium]|nr:hypothetical protein [Planctomycetota bacterium]